MEADRLGGHVAVGFGGGSHDTSAGGVTMAEHDKVIVVEFVGGFKDGAVLRCDPADPEAVMQYRYLLQLSDGGKVGTRFRSVSEAGLAELRGLVEDTPGGPRLRGELAASRYHVYELVDRRDDGHTIRLKYRFIDS
jgi:hypothetical protein